MINKIMCPECFEDVKPGTDCVCGWACPELKVYTVRRGYQGYVRGEEVRKVMAVSAQAAEAAFWEGEFVSQDNIRDDTATTDYSAYEA